MNAKRRRMFNAGLRAESDKPINGYATPQNIGFYEAGFDAGEAYVRSTLTDAVNRAANVLHSAENGGYDGRPSEVRGALRALLEAIEA